MRSTILAAYSKKPSATPDGSKAVPLPTEIYESIIDQLANSTTSLCSCALVCRLFAQRAQQHLFNQISLTRPTKMSKGTFGVRSYVWHSLRFLQILSKFPSQHLAGYVKSLKVSDGHPVKFYREELSWIRSDTAVHQILLLLVNLEQLSFEGSKRGSRLNFRKWGHDLRAAILERCSSERLVTIHLAYLKNVPLSLLSLAPRLEELELTKVIFIPEFDHLKVKERQPARLKHLSVTSMSYEEWRTFYPWLDQVYLDLMHLKILEIHVNSGNTEDVAKDLQAISNLVSGCSPTVQSLKLFLPQEVATMNLPFSLNLNTMPALRNLSLYSCVWNEDQSEIYSMAVPGTHTTPQLLPTTLRILTSIVSENLLSTTRGGQDSNPNSTPPHHRLETLFLRLTIDNFEEIGRSGFEDIGWEDFVTVMEELREAGLITAEESERESVVVNEYRPLPGVMSVIVDASVSDVTPIYTTEFLVKKLGRLRSEGVELAIYCGGLTVE